MRIIDLKSTGKNICKLMEIKGMSVRDLQSYFGFETPQAIYKWLRGVSLPTVDNLVVLSDVLGVKIDDVLILKRGGVMRLIDADALKYDLLADNYNAKMTPQEVADCIDNQPTIYEAEKVLAKLKEYANSDICRKHVGCPYGNMENVHCEHCGALGAIEIVRKGGVE